jgi:hypothetical protein
MSTIGNLRKEIKVELSKELSEVDSIMRLLLDNQSTVT